MAGDKPANLAGALKKLKDELIASPKEVATRKASETVLETLTEKIQRQERFIAQLQADLEQARRASVDTMLGRMRAAGVTLV